MQNAVWIWENTHPLNDEFAQFRETLWLEKPDCCVSVRMSADSDYALYVNGRLAAFGQYADLPHCKVVNTHDLTQFCCPGENVVTIDVWYHGAPSSIYQTGMAGLYFEFYVDGCLAAVSGTHTMCRNHPNYISHREKTITKELGFSICFDASGEGSAWHEAVSTGYAPKLHERPIFPLSLEPLQPATLIRAEGKTKYILDLQREEAGFLEISLESATAENIVISYSEHLVDGEVPRFIGKRDFSLEYRTQVGRNHWLAPFRRLGCRYLSVEAENPVQLHYAGIRPVMYPVRVIPFDAGSSRRQQIYDTAVRTLRLCMHEHYEDCPWREQALYAMDSRNQMLCGYYAFGETRFARASLWLFGQDRREGGFLSDCVPSGIGLVIPSFCLHWYLEVLEYTEFSGDQTLAREIWHKLCSVLDAFEGFRDPHTGLLPGLPTDEFWNFYEWSGRFLMGNAQLPGTPDLILNCLYLRALQIMEKLSAMTGLNFALAGHSEELRRGIRETFRRPDGLYNTLPDGTHICELGNALAVLTGVADESDRAIICKVLAGETTDLPVEKICLDQAVLTRVSDRTDPDSGKISMVPISLSMTTFVYDALLMADSQHYREFILSDVDARYAMMLDAGATTFWETMGGWKAFSNAGSLCHGWSALAVYYYHKLL